MIRYPTHLLIVMVSIRWVVPKATLRFSKSSEELTDLSRAVILVVTVY